MINSELNQFSKYQGLSTYKPKTQDRIIETRNPLDYYQQNKIDTLSWDHSLLQTKQPINKELDRINSLAETLFIRRDQKKQDHQQSAEFSQSKIEDVKEDFKMLELRNNQKVQELANIKNELLDIQCEYMSRSQLRLQLSEYVENKKKQGDEDQVLKQLKILQK
ncbi:unnamed protein product [Paramecium octaurelia]|uniref:Uncharacterized protein n=1 Tax=Paramecium octaurelia TaxID=43137 RepID=A0A8S1WZ36_PAROT|nr:unnamed protein product [Paramecium octaurelia]